MNLTKYIKVYKNAVPDSFCDEMIQKFEDNPQQFRYQKRSNPDRNFKMSFNQIHITQETNWKKETQYLLEDVFPKYVECQITVYKLFSLGTNQEESSNSDIF